MRQVILPSLLAALAGLAACDKARPLPGAPDRGVAQVPTGDPSGGAGGPTASIQRATCTSCHGTEGAEIPNADPLVSAAPPRALLSESDPGVHRSHLVAGPLSAPVECASCHLLPTAPNAHRAQKQGRVSFSRLATTSWTGAPLAPVWNGTTCASTYCHGNFTNGNAGNAPTWSAGVSPAQCGSCHGDAATGDPTPGGTHPAVAGRNCGACHGGTYDCVSGTACTAAGVDTALHVNGVLDGGGHPAGWKEPDQHGLAALQAALSPCTACHVGFGPASGVAGSSCDGCHATPSVYGPYATGTYPDHASWQTECTFCHGGASDATGAPPRNTHVISTSTAPQPTTDATIGAHASHVQGAHAIAAPLDCTACHETRWASALDPGHVDKATADVFFNPVGGTANPGGYARPSCSATYCHGNFTGGAGSGPVSWTGSFGATFTLSCTSCHSAPPGPTSATVHHPPNASCGTCHTGYTATTVDAATHVNGTVDHSPATGCTQCHGDVAVAGVASGDVLAAPASDASALDAHGNPATSTSSRGVGAHAKHLTGTAWRSSPIACSECHAVPAAGDVTHADGSAAVAFGPLASAAWAGQPAITPVWNGAGGSANLTCASTYCHGNFKNGANATLTWAAPSAVGCGTCHGTPPGGTHPANSSCAQCHDAAYSWNGTTGTVNPTLHMNGALDVVNLTCTTCHGTAGRASVAGADANQPAAPPVDTQGLASSAAVGAHLAHVNQGDAAGAGPLSSPIACSSCHVVPASTTHSDGTVNVTFGGLATTGGATPAPYNFTGHGCASTYCHGNFAGGNGANPIAWTTAGKLGCTSCHGAPPGPTSATVHHPPNPDCASCHAGYGPTGVNAATHVNGTIEHAPATGCTQCHGDLTATAVASTDVRAAPGSTANAVDAHGDLATATTTRGIGAHAKHLTSTTWCAAPIACSECHAPPAAGDVTHANGDPLLTFGLLASTAWAGQPAITPTWNGAGGGATVTCSSVYCHGAFPNGANATPTWTAPGSVACGSCHGSAATGDPTPGGGHPAVAGQNCGSCHGGAYDCVSGAACTAAGIDPNLHMNGVLDGGVESTGGSSCGGCHSAIFTAMNGGAPHVSRHALGNVPGTNDAPTDSGITWGNPLSTNAAAARSCVNMCHGDHPHDLTSPATATHENNAYLDATTLATRADGAASRIGVGGTGGTPNRTRTDYDGTQASGGVCVSCHQNPVDAARPAIAKAAFDAAAHHFTSSTVGATTWAWSYGLHDGGLFARDCTKCHASSAEGTTPAASGTGVTAVHFGDDASLLAGTKNPGGTPAGFVCYNCHGTGATPAAGAQGDRSGKDIQTQIAHATTAGQSGHPADSDAVHDSAAEFANAAFGNALGVAAGAGQRHASCLDCHAPHQARLTSTDTRVVGSAANGNVAGPALHGAWGVSWTGTLAGWAAPTSANFMKTPITAGTDLEATLCLKCHSAYYGALPASPSGGFTETDQAMEFNPSNAGFHPVLASASGNLGATGNIVAPFTQASLMTCTDCHESNAVADPGGPHGSAARFILKGPNTVWDASLALTGGAMPAGTFCANCHDGAFVGSRYPGHTLGKHSGVSCMTCHAAVPHGGPRPGMLVDSIGTGGGCTPAGGVIAGWDTTAPYASATRTDGLCIKSYPGTSATNWVRSNCGCNGSSH